MFKKNLLLSILISASALIYGQRKIYFESEAEKAIAIKGNSGIKSELSTIVNENGLRPAIKFEYITESVISKFSSVLWGVGLINSTYSNFVNYNSIKYSLQGNVFIEPRWYFNYKKRILSGKTPGNNNGLFLALPLEMNTSNLLTQNPLNINLSIPLVIGLRTDISSKLFFEVAGGAGLFTDFSSVSPMPVLGISITYTL